MTTAPAMAGSPLHVEDLAATMSVEVFSGPARTTDGTGPAPAAQALLDALLAAAKARPDRSLVDIIDSALYSEGYKSLDDWFVELGDARVAELVAAHYP